MNGVDLAFEVDNVFKSRTGFFENRHVFEDKALLRKVADVGVFCGDNGAAIRLHAFAKEFKKGGFTGAILANEADPIVSSDVQGDVFEYDVAAERQANIIQTNHYVLS